MRARRREVPPVPNPDNVPAERQLDEKGRATATAMGQALQRLKIPIGEVLTSPTYRGRETARLARLPNPRPVAELGEGTGSMQAVSKAQTEWLQKRVKELPRGTNTLLVTHVPNMTAAFPEFPAIDRGRGARVRSRRQGRRSRRGTDQDRGVATAISNREVAKTRRA